jgi:tRNA-dihydrouridine synthase
MKYYFAPMEGLTGYVYRNAHHAVYPKGIDKYFSPFIAANQSASFKTRDINDILPENNTGIILIPQLLTNKADDFISTAARIKHLGYDVVNLNLDCPSSKVVSKGKGSGFLANKAELDAFLDQIFTRSVTKISVKTRIGKDSPEEMDGLIATFNHYPLEELIIHPRVQADFYHNIPDMDAFTAALRQSKNPVCYNGDLLSARDCERFSAAYPDVGACMVGRGLLRNPGLIQELLYSIGPDKSELRRFHDAIYDGYTKTLSGDKGILAKMKELWSGLIMMFSNREIHGERINKSQSLREYEQAVALLFSQADLQSAADALP